ncbi:hypothetical protein [Bacillus phage PM1]|uniref:Uncharacterized protein n=1 Tax=Bacillus phage PM1 TaxID=547228 RepID=M5AC09_9CAUD|nr:hypothetical protein K203_gp59 [Bacillus phage PM1]BAM99139.1 hypothetical protein [Bacillus phage PM1]
MGRVKISPFEAGTKLLARDRYSSIKHKSFLFDFMEYMSEDGLNLDTKEAQKIYEYFDGAIQRTLENGELELFERDEQPEEPVPTPEPDDPTPDQPEEEPGQGQPIPPDEMDRPNPVDNTRTAINHIKNCYNTDPLGLGNIKRIDVGPYKGYVSGSNMVCLEEGEVITPINPFADKSEHPNGARHFEKWSAEAKKNQSVPNFNIQMDEVKKAVEKRTKTIDFFMHDFDLSESEAETVYYYLTEKDANSKGKPPINENAKDVLDHIKELTDIVNDL